jgi:HD superfamily phosphohydrolase
MKKVVLASEIPVVLEKYGFNVSRVIDDTNFSLLEQPIPHLCADRIDYFLRHLQDDGFDTYENFLDHLTVSNSKFALDNQAMAKEYALSFMDRCERVWTSAITLTAFNLLAKAIKRGLQIAALEEEDLFTDDSSVLKKLKSSQDPEIQSCLNLLTPNLKIEVGENNFDFVVKGKVRYVDPLVTVNGSARNLSALDPDFKEEVRSFVERIKAGHKIKIVGTG